MPSDLEPRLVGNSDHIASIRAQAERWADSNEPVLILGETGVGKEMVAQAIHARSRRRHRPLHVVNCAALSPHLLMAELFGHERGAFTDAARARIGRLRAADGATLVLDEISEAPAALQAALLRVVEQGEVQPVGSERTVRVDVRLMASSNRPFDELSSGGVLRHDLLHRLAAFVVHKQPLRARPADIAPLACMFLERLFPNARSRPSLSAAALRRLEAYAYPGNVRELRQILVRAAAHADGLRIGALAVEIALADSPLGGAISADAAMNSADVTLAGVIRRHLAATLDSTCGNLSAAARSLDVPRSTLQHYLSKFEIERADPQSSSRSA